MALDILFSVIIPVYNVEKYLEKCVTSVLKQTDSSTEIILVDDGSTDKSGALCDKLVQENTNRYIQVVHQENKGLGGARNTAIQHAKGEFLFFIDSDDAIQENCFTRLSSYIDSHPDADIVAFDTSKVDEKGNQLYLIQSCKDADAYGSVFQNKELLLTDHSACNKVIRKSLFTENHIEFPERLWFEDLATIIKLYPHAKKIGYIREPFYLYLQREGSIMNSENCDKNKDMLTACDMLLAYYQEQGLYHEFHDELEYLVAFHLYYLLSIHVLQMDVHQPLLEQFKAYTHEHFPDFMQNKYLTKKEKIILSLLERKKYKTILLIFKLKGFLNRFI